MDYHLLFRKLERQLSSIESQPDLKQTIGLLINSILDDYAEEFGFIDARLYVLDEDEKVYRLEAKFGASMSAPIGFTIMKSYAPIRRLCRQGMIYMAPGSEGMDPNIEEKLRVKRFAALAAGKGCKYIIAFTIQPERTENVDDILFALSSIRHAINQKLAQEQLEGVILQSRDIQLSLLPSGDVKFEGYDIYGKSKPAEEVGGDVFDYIRATPGILGVAIGDATGHGLPAALQARDVLMGLRMGISEDRKFIKVLEKLNKVINASRLTSRYISLFYGELGLDGHFIYSNAGHNPPFYYRRKKDRFYPMNEGGMVLGPTSNAAYVRGFFKINPGDSIIMYTDGITEAKNTKGEDFGEDRVQAFVRNNGDKLSAREMVDGLINAATEFSEDGRYVDDRTAVYIKRLA